MNRVSILSILASASDNFDLRVSISALHEHEVLVVDVFIVVVLALVLVGKGFVVVVVVLGQNLQSSFLSRIKLQYSGYSK